MKNIALALAVLSFASMPITAEAKACRNAKGHFMKCPPTAHNAMVKKAPCRNAKGHFIKCK